MRLSAMAACHPCQRWCCIQYEVVDSHSGSEPEDPATKQLKMKRNAQSKCKAPVQILPNDLDTPHPAAVKLKKHTPDHLKQVSDVHFAPCFWKPRCEYVSLCLMKNTNSNVSPKGIHSHYFPHFFQQPSNLHFYCEADTYASSVSTCTD